MAVPNPASLVATFSKEYKTKHGAALAIQHQLSQAGSAHIAARVTPPNNQAWVYVFSTTATALVQAGANKALRVGRTASLGRLSQHYGGGGSTANALVQQLSSQYFHWAYLGLNKTAVQHNAATAAHGWKATWGNWVKTTLDRDLFILPAGSPNALSELEKFIRGRLGPVFEG